MFLDFLPRLPRATCPLILGIVLEISLSISSSAVVQYFERRRRRIALSRSQVSELESRPIELRSDEILDGIYLNPGGSVKDRVAVRMIDDAERQGLLHPHTGSRIFEGTSGSTGISLPMVARARGYDATIVTPDDTAAEKLHALRSLGADVEQVRPASIVDNHPNSIAVLTDSDARGFFADQFENMSNYDAHFDGTGPEVWRQTNGNVRVFVSGARPGGTFAGVGRFVKSMDEDIVICLADPPGSGLYNRVKHSVMFDLREKEGTKRRHQVDTVVEGIGINRLTQNIELALPLVDDSFPCASFLLLTTGLTGTTQCVTDSEAVAMAMARYLVQHDGLFFGSSVRLVKKMGWRGGERVVTVLCDSGRGIIPSFGAFALIAFSIRRSRHHRHDDYLRAENIPIDLLKHHRGHALEQVAI
ncbi:PALP-domain-containing protein, partial [Mycena filopes]